MAPIYSVDNVYLSVAWTILGLANGVYLIVKQRYGNTNKRIWRTDKKEPKYRFFFILSIFHIKWLIGSAYACKSPDDII